MNSSRRAVLRSAAGTVGIAAAATLATTTEAAAATAATGGSVGWINVTEEPYNAPVNTSDDSQPAIQAAIDAAGQGGTVYLPPGQYRVATPLVLILGVTLRSDWAPHFPDRTNMEGAFIRPGIGNFTGQALIVISPAPVNGTYTNSAEGGGPRLHGLSLNGKDKTPSSTGSPIDAVYVAPGVKDFGMDKVTIWRFSGNGVNAQNAAALQFNQVGCTGNGGHGFTWGDAQGSGGGLVDADLIQCYSQANGGNGFDILNPNAVTMVDCRAEWNTGHGYNITGLNHAMVMSGCNTDRNGHDGFHLATSSGGRYLHLLGCLAKRDDSAGTGYSGFSVTGTAAEGVVLTGCSTSTGHDDDGTGDYSPSYGVTTATLNTASVVSVIGGQYVGTTAAFNDTAAALVRHSGVTTGVQTATGITWDTSDVHQLNGAAATNRDLQFWTRGQGARWTLRATDTAESATGAAGSDFAVVRHDNTGAAVDTPIVVRRDTGRITLGAAGTTTGNVEINAGSNPGLSLVQAHAAGQGYAVTGPDTGARAFQSSLTGEAINRFVIDIGGTQGFGPGGGSGRDTTWGRLGAAQIGTAESDIVIAKAGKGLRIKEDATVAGNKMGTLTLNGTTAVTVATTAVTANSRIFLTVQAPGGTPGGIAYVSGRTAGTSFTVKGAAGDLSTVAWLIVEPA
jgi:hypothetical protein